MPGRITSALICLIFNNIVMANTFKIIDVKEALNLESAQWIDVRSKEEHGDHPLKGVPHLNWEDLVQDKFGLLKKNGRVLDDPRKINSLVTKLGINSDDPIIIFGGASRWGDEGRIAWNFLYWGARRVYLVNGGWKVLKPYSKQVRFLKKTAIFKVSLQKSRRITKAEIEQLDLSKSKFIDVRSLKEYESSLFVPYFSYPALKNAFHFDDKLLYQKDGLYSDKNVLQKLRGVDFVYCLGGVRSALLALLLEDSFGSIVKNYDGSLWDWYQH